VDLIVVLDDDNTPAPPQNATDLQPQAPQEIVCIDID
jgi:hypothetical protein